MDYNPKLALKKSIRLKGWDYSNPGSYFITICSENHKHIFGNIVNGDMILNNAGHMIEKIYLGLSNKFQEIKLDKHIIMPNHFHAIITITNNNIIVPCPTSNNTIMADPVSDQDASLKHQGNGGIKPSPTIGDIICAFKSITTNEYIKGVRGGIYPPFKKRIWQLNYYEHIIRNEEDYKTLWEYIDTNPIRWELDKYYVQS